MISEHNEKMPRTYRSLKKTTKSLDQESQLPVRESNTGPSEYYGVILTTER